jgi:hypothetical protein
MNYIVGDTMDNLEIDIIKLQTYKMQHETAQIQLGNAELQHKLLEIQLQKESWQKAELEGRIHEDEREKQYAKKNKKYTGYQPNDTKLNDLNPPTGGSGVPSLPPTPKRPPKKCTDKTFILSNTHSM